MKIVAILNNRLGAGGGFDQALNAVLQMQRLCAGRFDFEVLTSERENLPVLQRLRVSAQQRRFGLVDRLLMRWSGGSFWQALQRRLKLIGPTERRLLQMGCDVAYFVMPDGRSAALQRLAFIGTVWDLCHRDHPEFPEVRDFNEIATRERQLRGMLAAASLVLCDADASVQALQRRYGSDADKLLAMPFAPSPMLEDGQQPEAAAAVRRHHGLDEPYFFYPAQFWAHKNHVCIVEALRILKAQGWSPTVVFCGKDYGNLGHVRQRAADARVLDQIRFLGFVPSGHMRGLYEGAVAVLMPTYFGPTNLPPLEAWSLGTPLVYAAHLAQQAGDAALLAEPGEPGQWAEAMRACTDSTVRQRLVAAGHVRLAQISAQRTAAEAVLVQRLLEIAARRACWA